MVMEDKIGVWLRISLERNVDGDCIKFKMVTAFGNFCNENIIFPKLFIFSKEIMFLS